MKIWNLSRSILTITLAGLTLAVSVGISRANDCGVQAQKLFVNGGVGSHYIDEFTPGGALTTFASTSYSLENMAFNSAGDLFAAVYGGGNIYEYTNGVAVQKGTFASGLNEPFALAFNSAGDLFVTDLGSGNIYKFTPDGARTTFASGFSDGATSLAFDSAGDLFVSDYYYDCISLVSHRIEG